MTGPTLKKALCHILTLVGRRINNGAPKKGNGDEAEGIFGLAGRVWASALRPDPPQKWPCATFVRWWDV